MYSVKQISTAFIILAATYLVSGCGDNDKANVPAVKLTASTVTSRSDATTHTHSVTIPFTDISALPSSDIYQYRSTNANGHSHVIALSKQQVIDANNGMRLALVSSPPDSGADHTHTWAVQGGDLLYEKYCYNCHTNDKRSHTPMNVSFNGNQTNAVINPAGAQLSTAAAAIPDLNYSPSVSLDGISLYTANCSSCHGALATSTKSNRTFTQIKTAINSNTGGMASFGALTDAQLQAIATALVK